MSYFVLLIAYYSFQVNLERPCRFWTPSFYCADKDCNLECCSQEEVPFIKMEKVCHGSGEYPPDLGQINYTVTSTMNNELNTWALTLPGDICFCDPGTQFDSDCETYYDLKSNREQYTAYKGKDAQRIWNSVYKENCFRPPTNVKSNKLTSIFAENKLANLCIEKRAFYRLLSGLHTSISIHLCHKYKFPCTFLRSEEWGINLDEFYFRFNPVSTDNQGPIWLKNLYFTFLVELKAILKSEKVLKTAIFYTGNSTQDIQAKQLVLNIIELIKSANISFNETLVFFTDYANIVSLKDRFRNITNIMDCVSCQRCRLWGKLQVKALATSLNILFHSNSLFNDGECDKHINVLDSITRTEIVSLFNGVAKLSESISIIDSYRNFFST